jgi:EAL domain-containing protein (putative c-di-GMP-specific phosphodiesterase class I)
MHRTTIWPSIGSAVESTPLAADEFDDHQRTETSGVPRFFPTDVSELIAKGRIGVAFQPIVDLQTGDTYGFEALVRCLVPELASPPTLLDAAQEQGSLGLLGRCVRELGVAQCARNRLFFNIQPAEFDEEWLIQPDEPACAHHHQVYLEITEAMPLYEYRFCGSILSELRARGIKIAIDDFGAGYSNLKYITDLRPDVVKLDRQFVDGVRNGSREQQLIASMVELCRIQGATVVAEGVETMEELDAIRRAGVRYAQGFVFAKPDFVAQSRNWSAMWK